MNIPLESFSTSKCTLLPISPIPAQILTPFFETFSSILNAIYPTPPKHSMTNQHYLIRKFFSSDRITKPPLRFQLTLANVNNTPPGTPPLTDHPTPSPAPDLLSNIFNSLNPATDSNLQSQQWLQPRIIKNYRLDMHILQHLFRR